MTPRDLRETIARMWLRRILMMAIAMSCSPYGSDSSSGATGNVGPDAGSNEAAAPPSNECTLDVSRLDDGCVLAP